MKFHHKSTDRKILMFKTYLLKHVRTYFLLTLLKHNALVLCVIHIMMLFLQSVIRTDLRMLGQLMVSRFMVLVSNSLVLVLRHVGLPHITDWKQKYTKTTYYKWLVSKYSYPLWFQRSPAAIHYHHFQRSHQHKTASTISPQSAFVLHIKGKHFVTEEMNPTNH